MFNRKFMQDSSRSSKKPVRGVVVDFACRFAAGINAFTVNFSGEVDVKLMVGSWKTILILAMAASFSPSSLYAQTFGEITGRVTDTSGAVVSGAAVTLTNANTNGVRNAVTTDAGVYTFPSVPPGSYNLKTEVSGFKTSISEPFQVQVQQVDPAELSPGEFAFLVRQAVERDQARVVVIDSLNGYMNAMPEEQFLTAQLHELLTYLGRKGVTTLLVVAQHGMMGTNMQSPVDTSYLADSVVLLRYFEYAGKVKKAISVLKKRSGAHEESIRELRFDQHGIHLSEPLVQFRGILTGVPVELKSTGNEPSNEPRNDR
jgi:hypothetical protein